VTGEPSGLAATLPKALAELTKAAGPGAQIMVGFDRGGRTRRCSGTAATSRRTGHLPAGAAGGPGHPSRFIVVARTLLCCRFSTGDW
jgi:hypothetical protein